MSGIWSNIIYGIPDRLASEDGVGPLEELLEDLAGMAYTAYPEFGIGEDDITTFLSSDRTSYRLGEELHVFTRIVTRKPMSNDDVSAYAKLAISSLTSFASKHLNGDNKQARCRLIAVMVEHWFSGEKTAFVATKDDSDHWTWAHICQH